MSRFTKIKTILTAFICLAFICITGLGMPVYADSAEDVICIEYTLSNGFEYTLKPSVVDHRTIEERKAELEPVLEYVFLLPKNVEGKGVKIYPANDILKGVTTENDGTVILDKGWYTAIVNGEEISVTIAYTSDTPQLYVTVGEEDMKNVHWDKNYKAEGYITITDGIDTPYDGKLDYIKGRGNATWTRDPKPYNIKLASKVNLFNMGASKKYSLLANFSDYTCLRNKVCLEFAQEVGIEYTSDVEFVELYVNNKYFGTYSLTERVEVDPSRVDIFDIDVLNEFFNPDVDEESLVLEGDAGADCGFRPTSAKWYNLPNQAASRVDGGYLLEIENGKRYTANAAAGFVSADGQAVNIESPEYASEEQVKYIQDYYQQFEDAVLSDSGYNSRGRHYSEYIDVDSFAKMYVFLEFVQNYDTGNTSCFMYKDVDSKIVAGPLWDMDVALGYHADRYGKNIYDSDNMWVAETVRSSSSIKGKTIFAMLWTHADFRQAVIRQWNEVYKDKIDSLYENLTGQSEIMYDSSIWCQYITKNPFDPKSMEEAEAFYEEHLNYIKDYIPARAEFLSGYFARGNSSVMYYRNGGSAYTVDPATYAQGQKATVAENGFINGESPFIGWNTKPDGSGEWYYPGSEIEMENEDVYLYAQWQGGSAQQDAQNIQQQNISIFKIILEKFKNLF